MTKLLDLSIKSAYAKQNNCRLLPESIRACIIGKSRCGKTNLLFDLLLSKFDGNDYLDYDNLLIFSKSLHQPIYQRLIEGLEAEMTKSQILKHISKQDFEVTQGGNQTIRVECFENVDEVPDPASIDLNLKTLIIFDDVMLEKQSKVEAYYTRGRHNNIDCFYISQNYIKLPKNTIRENTNLFILFKQDSRNLGYFYRDHCADLKQVYYAWPDFITVCYITLITNAAKTTAILRNIIM